MKKGRLMRSWFDLHGMKMWNFNHLRSFGFVAQFHHLPSPVHDPGDINEATLRIHGLINKEISEGNY